MVKNARQKRIIDLLNEEEVVTVNDLSERLNFSSMTIRRDLEYLEKKGILKRVHGGAVLLKQDNNLPSFQERIKKCEAEKNAIGKLAVSLITPESVVCFDSGTTTLAVAQNIPDDLQFTAITTGLITAVELCSKPKVEIIQVGGRIHHSSYTASNFIAVDFIKQFNADIAFLATRAFDSKEGTFEANINHVQEKRALASIANKVVLLLDHTKFESRALLQTLSLKDIDTIITDNKVPERIIENIRESGIEVLLAEV